MRSLPLIIMLVMLTTTVLAADADNDGIQDTFDGCPDTPLEATIVDPVANVYYAGCTCDQVAEIVDRDNPCLNYFCYQEVLEMRNKPYGGPAENCPDDECKDYAFYDYPLDGFHTCANMKLQKYSCEPVITEHSALCGYTIPDENVSKDRPIPILTGNTQSYLVTNGRITFSLPEQVYQGEKVAAKILFVTQTTGTTLNPVITVSEHEVPQIDIDCAGAGNNTFWCLGKWDLPTNTRGEQEITITFTYDPTYNPGGDDDTITTNISFPFIIESPPFTPKIAQNPVVAFEAGMYKPLSPREEFLIKSIYEELFDQGATDKTLPEFENAIWETAQHFNITKEVTYDEHEDITTFSILVKPNKGIVATNMTIIEYLPKELVEHVDNIEFSVEPIIIREDPLIVWHFATVDEEFGLAYEVEGETQVTGNTIATTDELANQSSPLFIIIPMLMIPLIILLLVGLPRLLHRKH